MAASWPPTRGTPVLSSSDRPVCASGDEMAAELATPVLLMRVATPTSTSIRVMHVLWVEYVGA